MKFSAASPRRSMALAAILLWGLLAPAQAVPLDPLTMPVAMSGCQFTDVADRPVRDPTALRAPVLLPTAGEPRPDGVLTIEVDTYSLQLRLYADGVLYKTYPVAIGRQTMFTLSPVGEWRIVYKGMNWGGGFGTRWLGLNVPWGIYGIHGTNAPSSIGTHASAGCIRMQNRDVEELYDWVSVGTEVRIIGDPPPHLQFDRRLRSGSTGNDVVFIQLQLDQMGFDPHGADGRFGPNTENAVRRLQQLYGLPVDGTVYEDVYFVLGFR